MRFCDPSDKEKEEEEEGEGEGEGEGGASNVLGYEILAVNQFNSPVTSHLTRPQHSLTATHPPSWVVLTGGVSALKCAIRPRLQISRAVADVSL